MNLLKVSGLFLPMMPENGLHEIVVKIFDVRTALNVCMNFEAFSFTYHVLAQKGTSNGIFYFQTLLFLSFVLSVVSNAGDIGGKA